MAEWRPNGGMVEWRTEWWNGVWNGGMVEWQEWRPYGGQMAAEWRPNGGMAEWQEWQNGGMVEWRNGRMAYGMAKWQPSGGMVKWQEWRPNGGMVEWRRWQNGRRNGQILAEWSNGGIGYSNGGNVNLPTILWYTPTTKPTTTPTPFNLL